MLQGGVGVQNGVIGLNNGSGHLRHGEIGLNPVSDPERGRGGDRNAMH